MRYKPKNGERYYLVNSLIWSLTPFGIWTGDDIDKRNYRLGNCFKTKEMAMEALKQIKVILKK